MFNRLYILLDVFLIGVFPLSSIVFARLYCYYRELLLGVGLAVARDCVPPSFHLCLPYNIYILGDYQGVFQGSFGWFGLFRPGAARAPNYVFYSTY